MPEIKNTFLAGRLNKDLDERLVGQGEYRDALNVNVAASETSDASTVENMMGNEIIGPDFSNLTTTRTVTTPGTPAIDAIPPIPAGPDIITVEEQELSVVSYTPYTPATDGTPDSATQTMTLQAPLLSEFPTRTDNVRVGQVLINDTNANVGDTTISINAQTSTSYHPTYGTYNQPVPKVGAQVAFVSDSGLVGTHTSNLPASQRYTIMSITETGTNTNISPPAQVYTITLDRPIGSEWTQSGVQYASINHYQSVGGITYRLTDGTLYDQDDTNFLDNEQLQLTHGTDSPITITFDSAASEDTATDYTTSDAFAYTTGDTLTFDRFYEFARPVSAFVSSGTDGDGNFTATLSPNELQVGDFYGHRQPSVLGSATLPSVTAVNGDTVTLSATPVENYDTTLSGARVYGLRYVGGGGAEGEPAVDASLTVSKFEFSDPDPQVGEFINDVRINSVTRSFANFTLGLNSDISPIPTAGSTLTIPRTVITPGTPAVPGVPGVPAGPDTVTTVTEALALSAKCIGSIADESNNKIYWFVITQAYDGIYEYDSETNTVEPLIRGALNFSKNNLITGVNLIDGMLFWTDDLNEPRKLNIEKWKKGNNSSVPTRIYSRDFVESDLTVIKPHPKTALSVSTEINPNKEILPFEEIFPQFGYRWKYSDGEYSPFSFFTPPVFEVADYETKEHFKEGYNKAARNIITEVTLNNIPRGDEDVISLDILYTESISSTVYTLKTIRKKDFGVGEYVEPQTFTKRSFYSALPANQLSRHFDSVPPKAKAQEVTANRLIYGNYEFGFEQPASNNLTVTQVDKSANSGLSIKSLRNYEIGTVYEDAHGRQGALITGNGGIYSTKFSTEKTQQLQVKINSSAPSWATHFKHYVKESSNDHHNFPVYNVFNDGDAAKNNSEFVWLQIDSNDRNKVSEDTFIVPRRHTHGDVITGNGTNSLAFARTGTVSIHDMNLHDKNTKQKQNALIFAGGTNPSNDFSTARDGNITTDAPDWIFTCAVPGKYTFVFEGELKWVSRSKGFADNDILGSAYVKSLASFQKVRSGSNFASLTWSYEDISAFNITEVKSTGNESRDFRFYTSIEYDLEAGDRVRPVIVKTEGRSKGRATMDLTGGVFKTLTTPVDPNAELPSVEQFNHIIKEVSKHRIIEIESEAPDIVKAQLPIETAKLGNTIEVTPNVTNDPKKLFLTDGFEEPHDTVETTYDENSTELYYEMGQNSSGFKRIPFISALNQLLGYQNLGSLTISEDITALQPAEYVETIDVTELEGGLWFGVGPAGVSTVTNGTENKIKVKEISLGYSQFNVAGNNNARDVLKIILEEPIGVNPMGQDIAFFKGTLTENALKNLQGSFFAKIKRATGNGGFNTRRTGLGIKIATPYGYPNITTAQSTFNEENEINTLQTIWFETMPETEDSNLNLFWEASSSIPISEHGDEKTLDFYNCVAFVEEGVFLETQRIYDKFNSVQMTKGVRVNVPQENYAKEHRKAGLIFSGIYNSRTGTNRLNEFVYSDGITKDLEPNYGSLQKLYTRDTNLVALCEDKVFQIMADKDILFNANGGAQVTASNKVLGQTTPFQGDFGIGFEPASFASFANRMYFVDRTRGSVIRLSTDGITQISEAGMSDFFKDKLANNNSKIIGSYDTYKGQYVLTLDDYSVTFSEKSKGWVSRVSYVPENGISVNNNFYTFNSGDLWQHYSLTALRNNFYNQQYVSSLTTVFNQEPSSIKSFKTINYEGTPGWAVPLILTDQQAGNVIDFENKEGKWYNNINGISNKNVVGKINDLLADDTLDFYKEDRLTALQSGLSPEDVYEFSDETNSSKNQHLGVGQLVGITLTDGSEPSDVVGNTTITFNVQ